MLSKILSRSQRVATFYISPPPPRYAASSDKFI